jgi:hypothetical protein
MGKTFILVSESESFTSISQLWAFEVALLLPNAAMVTHVSRTRSPFSLFFSFRLRALISNALAALASPWLEWNFYFSGSGDELCARLKLP